MKFFKSIFFLFLALIIGCNEDEPDTIYDKSVYDEFGINLNQYKFHIDSIKTNESISSIFANVNLDINTINEIVDSSKKYYDLSLIKPGNKIYFYFSKASDSTIKYFVYQINSIEYCFVDLTNGIKVSNYKKETFLLERIAAGKINSSLYQALIDANINTEVAIKLAEIFAWEIDFYRLQPDDYFKVVFDELYVDGKFVQIDKIKAAEFYHNGERFFAFGFNQNNELEYFNEEGKSLRKQFLKSPLKFSKITSGFSLKRFHPVQKIYKAHLGTDYAAPAGTPILAVADGVVIEASYKQFNGNYIKIKHNSTYTTQYLHMSKFAKGIKQGVSVSQGQVIGYVGSTGLATGSHVCFRFWKNNQQVDHRREKFPSSYPVSKERFEEFAKVRDSFLEKLNNINTDFNQIQFALR